MESFWAEHFSFVTTAEGWVALVTLVAMEVVLGIDNLIFISILSNKLPEADRSRAAGRYATAAGITADATSGNDAAGWFSLGDQDLGTHLYRTSRMRAGATLTQVTAEITGAWDLGLTVLPVSDDPVRTVLTTADGADLTFQEYFVQRRHGVPVRAVHFDGATDAIPTFLPEVASADAVVIAPSNPIVSIGPIRALSGVDAALTARRDSVVAISPIIAGAALKGPADRMLVELGHEASVVGVARLYAPICSTLVIDQRDADAVARVEAEGVRCVVADTIMSSLDVARALALTTIGAVA